MKTKEDNKEQFIAAMFNLVKAIKSESENCGKSCGGFNEKEQIVIIFVGQNQNVKMSDIAENIDSPMSTLTSIVDKLVEKEFLSRDHSGEDRRVINVTLSQNGKAAFKNILTQKKLIAERMLSSLNDKEQKAIIKNMNYIASAMITPK